MWSLLSSGAFGAEHKVPQEQLAGSADEGRLTALLLTATEESLGLAAGSLSSKVTRNLPSR